MAANWGFCGGTYVSESPNIDNEEAINIYCERSESQAAKTPMGMLFSPGLRVAYSLPEASVPSLFPINGRGFAAASKLYELFPGAGFNALGSLGSPPLSPTQIIANETQLLILNNGNLYVLTLATNVLVPVDMSQFNNEPVLQIDFCDGFGIATLQNSHTFQVSALEDFTTWNGLDISTISYFPDNIVSMIVDHREIWFFSGKKSLGFYNAGAGRPPFIPIQGAFLEDGADSAFGTVRADNSVFFLNRDERGALVAKRLDGYTGQRVSTHAVEYAWQQYSVTSDAVAYSFQMNGHVFVQWYFPTANATWVYDVSTQLWHRRGFWETRLSRYSAHRSMSHMYFSGRHLVGDWASGNIYQMSTSFYDDAGNPLRWLRRSPTINKENEWVYFPALEIDTENGLGPQPPLFDGDGNPRSPEIILRWSDDGGKTWPGRRILKCGQAGKYNSRARTVMLGRGRKRIWECSSSDPIPWRIADAYLQMEPQSA